MNNNIDPVDEAPATNDSEPEIPPAVEYDAIADGFTSADGPGGTDPNKPHGKLP